MDDPGLRTNLFHFMRDLQRNRNGAKRPDDPAGTDGIPDRLKYAMTRADFDIFFPGRITSGRVDEEHEIRPWEGIVKVSISFDGKVLSRIGHKVGYCCFHIAQQLLIDVNEGNFRFFNKVFSQNVADKPE